MCDYIVSLFNIDLRFLFIADFDANTDDYVSKPIKPKVIVSRIYALLRRITDPIPLYYLEKTY